MASYADYDRLLKEKDKWIDLVNQCPSIAHDLKQYATLNGTENAASRLDKAVSIILNEQVWQGNDARACASTLNQIRNEIHTHCNFLTEDVCRTLKAKGERKIAELQRQIDACLADMDTLGTVELYGRSFLDQDMKR